MEYNHDTITAISTPYGKGGLHIIRLSGDESINIVRKVFKGKNLNKQKTHSIVFGKIYDEEELIDEVLISVFRMPHSYTGENVVEISCHGNQYIAERILQVLLRYTRLALPGEFTQRAYFNDKIDLLQAEAIADLLSAQTRFAHKLAIDQMEGKLGNKINSIRKLITKQRILLELEIDFAEDDTGEIDFDHMQKELEMICAKLRKLLQSAREGLILRQGYKVCFAGEPNVGKSSIFNKFLETERAIVTPVPGTTRDYLEEAVSLNGFLVRFFDTAGFRQSSDQAEKEGIRRSYEIVHNADLIIYIDDGKEKSLGLRKDLNLPSNIDIIRVLNKTDLLSPEIKQRYRENDFILCSALTKDGITELKHALLQKLNIKPRNLDEAHLSNSRQIAAVKACLENVQQALTSLKEELSCEFIAFDLQQADSRLGEVTGAITSEEILNEIFSDFCIGK